MITVTSVKAQNRFGQLLAPYCASRSEPSLMKVKKEMERHFMWIFHLLATKVKKYMQSTSEESGSVFALP